MGFSGKHNYTIVDCNDNSANTKRIVMHTGFRAELGSEFHIFLHKSNCLRLYPEEYWLVRANNMSERVDNAEMGLMSEEEEEAVMREARDFFGNVYDGKMDKQGRITLTANMLKHAGIENDVVIVGLNRFIEIWNPEAYEKSRLKR